MDTIGGRERDLLFDLESGLGNSAEHSTPESVETESKSLFAKAWGAFIDETTRDGDSVVNCNGVSAQHVKLGGEKTDDHGEKKFVKEKRKKPSNKRASKPPRPPRGPLLDAADQKLIKEISELAMLKRARIERMKALKKTKSTKPSSSSNIFAMVFTVLFILVILCHGMSPRATPGNLQGSPVPAETKDDGMISVIYLRQSSANGPNGQSLGPQNSVEPVAGTDRLENIQRRSGEETATAAVKLWLGIVCCWVICISCMYICLRRGHLNYRTNTWFCTVDKLVAFSAANLSKLYEWLLFSILKGMKLRSLSLTHTYSTLHLLVVESAN